MCVRACDHTTRIKKTNGSKVVQNRILFFMGSAVIKIRKRHVRFIILKDDIITENLKYFKTHDVSYMTVMLGVSLVEKNALKHLQNTTMFN